MRQLSNAKCLLQFNTDIYLQIESVHIVSSTFQWFVESTGERMVRAHKHQGSRVCYKPP
jgi:hypothetical protein